MVVVKVGMEDLTLPGTDEPVLCPVIDSGVPMGEVTEAFIL